MDRPRMEWNPGPCANRSPSTKVNSELNPLPAAYQTWRSGCIDNGNGTSSIQQMVTGPTTFSYATARHNTATDCTGINFAAAPQ